MSDIEVHGVESIKVYQYFRKNSTNGFRHHLKISQVHCEASNISLQSHRSRYLLISTSSPVLRTQASHLWTSLVHCSQQPGPQDRRLLHQRQVLPQSQRHNLLPPRQRLLQTSHVLRNSPSKNYLEAFLPYFDLIAFDFAGCGLSEGEYITLGYNEREDVYSVVNYARTEFRVTNVILWGRSMGAATSLLYTAKYGGVKAIISDNSYADL